MTLRLGEESSERVVVSERPLLMPGMCAFFFITGLHDLIGKVSAGTLAADNDAFGIAVCLGLGGIGFAYSARYTRYRFERYSGLLHWRRWQLWQRSSGVIPLAAIRRVRVEHGPDYNDGMGRIVLETDSGDVPLSNAYTANRPYQLTIAERIRTLLPSCAAAQDGEQTTQAAE